MLHLLIYVLTYINAVKTTKMASHSIFFTSMLAVSKQSLQIQKVIISRKTALHTGKVLNIRVDLLYLDDGIV